jgi:hypothetical protein
MSQKEKVKPRRNRRGGTNQRIIKYETDRKIKPAVRGSSVLRYSDERTERNTRTKFARIPQKPFKTIAYTCENSRFLMVAYCMTISNPDLLYSSEKGVDLKIKI